MPLEWQPEYPDLVPRRRSTHPLRLTGGSTVRPLQGVQAGAVTFSYPDDIKRRKLHPSVLNASAYTRFEPQPPAINAFMSWMGQLPTSASKKKIHPSRVQFLALGRDGSSGIPAPHMSWQPEYPDRVYRFKLATSQQVAQKADPTPLFVSTDPRFLGVYPDRIYRSKYPPSQQLEWVGPQPTSVGPTVRPWDVHFPDWIAPKKGLQARFHPVLALNEEPIPDPPVVENSWEPEFPDFALKSRIATANQPYFYWFNFTPPRVPWEWQNQRPDFAYRAKRNPFGGTFRPDSEAPAHLPADWVSTFPDLIDRLIMRERPAVFEPSTSVFPANAALHAWDAEFPDFLRRMVSSMLYAATGGVGIHPLTVIADALPDCITFRRQSVVQSGLEQAQVSGSTLLNETFVDTDMHSDGIC